MRRKSLIILVVTIFGIGLTGCGKKIEIRADVIDNEGNSSKMSANEIIEMKQSNAALYNENYSKAKIEVISYVEEIKGPYQYMDHDEYYIAYEVALQGNWSARVDRDNEVLKKLKKGDKVKVSEVSIAEAFHKVELVGVEKTETRENRSIVWKYLQYPDKTKIEIIK